MSSATRVSSAGLKARAHELGFELVGVCDAVEPPHLSAYSHWLDKGYHGGMEYLARHLPLKEHPRRLLESARSVVAVGLNYNQENPHTAGKPRIARYALGRDYHKVIRAKLRALATWIQSVHPGSECRPCVDSAPIMERDFAQLAGLGWFGKNTMLIDSRRGSWFLLGLLLTDIPFEVDSPAVGGCGSCTRCIDSCPSGAIVFEDGRWQIDARRCVSYLTIEHAGPISPQLASVVGDWTFGCDVCQEVCPFNQPRDSQPLRAAATVEPSFLARRDWPGLTELPQLDEERWDALTRGSAIRRTGLEGIRRNAAINLESERS